MSEPQTPETSPAGSTREEELAMRFAQLVLHQANLGMMLLGRTPHPDTGEPVTDLDGARMIVDQLEMLEVKTRGNLTRHEEALLKQTLMSLRMAFVEAVESPGPAPASAAPAAPEKPAEPGAAPAAQADSAAAAAETESRKKFSKKY
jgi:hypothetical protein